MPAREMPPAIARQMPYARREVEVEGVTLNVFDDGPRDAPPMLFLHGNPAWAFLWRKLMGPMMKAGLRVVAPDHAGFGLSDKPTDPTYYSLKRHVENQRAVVRELDLRDITLVIHDWGGPIGMGLAAEEPGRIARIAVCNTVAFTPTAKRPLSPFHAVLGSAPGYHAAVAFGLVERIGMTKGVAKPLPPEVREAYRWPMRDKGGRLAAARFVRMVPDGPDHPEAATLRAYEERYHLLQDKPMAVLWADRDPVMRPRLAERWRKSFPHATVQHVAPEAGHFWQEDASEKYVSPLLAFAT